MSVPADAWQVREDVKGKGGFIRELELEILNKTNIPAKKFNNTNELVFRFRNSTDKFDGSDPLRLTLQLVYLRTYRNAGRVDVYYCDQLITTLSALWTDYDHPQAQSFTINHCKAKEPFVRIVHTIWTEYGDFLNKKVGNQKFKLISVKVCSRKAVATGG